MKSMFWGVIFILFGVSFILKAVFGINLPVFKIFFGGLLIYWGLSLLIGSFGHKFSIESRKTANEALFAEAKFQVNPDAEGGRKFSTVFGSGQLDLTEVDLNKFAEVEFDSVFAESVVTIKKGTPFRVISESVFASTKILGEKNSSLVGNFTYNSPNMKEAEKFLVIKSHVVFGNFTVEEK